MNNNTNGFTLVELMLTLVIFTTLISMIVPSLTSLYAYIRAELNIRKIQQTILFARNQAIAYNTRVTVCPLDGNSCSKNWHYNISVFSDSGQKYSLDGNDQLILQIGPFHTSDLVQYNRRGIRFQGDGLASGTNGTLSYCPEKFNSELSKAVIVSQSGRTRFSKKKIISCKNNSCHL
ncbi:GspH/FimT family pseudopilin [Shewanella youngdeokensis]|uniref:Type II secretion system protein H n=1 Tax=Shewanella youngdeokensis TaxID=2999068 RepID=A0ABZ0JXK3_9GAMM|nr:GspH/FimT family pseudopilin [Shewanella sp. DAU334]